MKPNLVDYIGVPALLEQLAEECVELAHASLKLARSIRGENKVYGASNQTLLTSLFEEIADVDVTLQELDNAGLLDDEQLKSWLQFKMKRMEDRFEKEEL